MKNWISPSQMRNTECCCGKYRSKKYSIHLYARLDVDGGDLLDDLGGRVQVDDTLVNPHLELVPGLGTLTCQ